MVTSRQQLAALVGQPLYEQGGCWVGGVIVAAGQLPAGIYLLTLQQGNYRVSTKLVREQAAACAPLVATAALTSSCCY